jgi:WD40 repeat protein
MELNWKRIGLAIAFVAGVILAGYGLYYLFLRPLPTTPPVTTNTNGPVGGLQPTNGNANIPIVNGGVGGLTPGQITNTNTVVPGGPTATPAAPVASGGPTQIKAMTAGSAVGATLDISRRDMMYYNRNDGRFYRTSPSGQTTALSDKVFPSVQNITWSPDRSEAVLEFPDGANVVYDFATKKQVTLPKHWADFSFSPTGTRLVFKSLGDNADARWLAVANADGSQSFQVEHLGDQAATVYPSWSPNNQIVAMYTKGSGYDQQELYFLGLNNENFPLTKIEGRGLVTQWTPKGDALLYSVYNADSNNKPTLWVVAAQGDAIGQNRRNLGLQTWADKCVFGNDQTIYCAVPRDLPDDAGIFRSQFSDQPDDIYKIDLATGFKSFIAKPQTDQTIRSLSVSGDGQYLYFSSATDGNIYQMKLR